MKRPASAPKTKVTARKAAPRVKLLKKPVSKAGIADASARKTRVKVLKKAVSKAGIDHVFLVVKRHWRKAPPMIISNAFSPRYNTRGSMYGFECIVLDVCRTRDAAEKALRIATRNRDNKGNSRTTFSIKQRQVCGGLATAHVWIVTSSIWEEFFGEDEEGDGDAPLGYPLNKGDMGEKPGKILGVFNSLQGANAYATGEGFRDFSPDGLFGSLEEFSNPVSYKRGLATVSVCHIGGDGAYDGELFVGKHTITG
eukprot:gnl/TRDRNA2_/TRDRNA2_200201_c0_seq1.p1 gnl/TRDRNA2_/TRDRNA2_200201_c0~~gnl/TRDRNA2_/TRDRNA2_200201_c0_seq1.p1  ORF type:complete len:254 (+),score=31.01 gnl/TRDRNA2_/TRDRNA2_200201_c0_seq1:63-824(+)